MLAIGQPGEEFWSSKEVARWLGVTSRTVRLWAECGEIPALRAGRQWRFRPNELKLWLNNSANPIGSSRIVSERLQVEPPGKD
jgi:excisionase family DNA binding protein